MRTYSMTMQINHNTSHPSSHLRRRTAFTLFEMLAVVALLALFVATVSVNYKVPLRQVRLQNAEERIEGLDRRLRLVARDSGKPLELRIILDKGVFSARESHDTGTFSESYVLPSGISLEEVYVGADRVTDGEAMIRFASSGTTATYAICLRLPDRQQQWILVVGGTGQTVQFDDGESVKPFLSLE